jgi:hypothetical protein
MTPTGWTGKNLLLSRPEPERLIKGKAYPPDVNLLIAGLFDHHAAAINASPSSRAC